MLDLPENEKSIWRKIYKSPLYPKLDKDLEVDTIVIGGGITGLTSAYLIKRIGHKVALIEKDTIGGGTSGRSTGKVTSQHGIFYSKLRQYQGAEAARVYADANQAAVELIAKIIKRENIRCDWKQSDNYVFTENKFNAKKLQNEAMTAEMLGLPASFETKAPLPFEVKGALKFTSQAKIHLQKYLMGLARKVNGHGSHVFENSEATTIRDTKPARVVSNGFTITAKNIIVATNVPTLPLAARGAYCILEYPTVSYAIAGKPGINPPGMYISPDRNHYSIMPVEIGSEKLMLIVGAGGHLPGLAINKEARYRRLANYAEESFGMKKITHRWSDRDYLAYDNVPLVGKMYPWSDNLYVATAFKKWGITNGTVAATILRDLLQEKNHPLINMYNSLRLRPIASIPDAFVRHFYQRR